MKFPFFLFFLCATPLVGCSSNDSPPEFSDVKNIVIDGVKLSAEDYYNKYCKDPKWLDNNYCIAADDQLKTERVLKSLFGGSSSNQNK